MPVLEALTRLSRERRGEQLLEILHRMAPAWLAQMPSLVSAEDRLRLQTQAQGTTQQRMLREMAEALEVMASEKPLALFLEDLHWSDPSTLELIATIARRNEPARLLILGTYRPVEMLASDHPLRTTKEELELHQHCIELRLPLLSEADVAAYLTQRFGDGKAMPRPDSAQDDGGLEPIDRVAPLIHVRTEGNPLFMVNIIDYLLEQGSLFDASKVEAPRNIRQMIERNLQRQTADEQRMLEAASVAGAEFSAAAIAAALERPLGEVEACCTGLARREHFIRAEAASHWPDGTMATGYRFLHALYNEVLYERVPVGSRAELHRRIAEREEAAYGDRCDEIAPELAHHFALGGNRVRAVEYCLRACQQCVDRASYREAIAHFEAGLEMLQGLPDEDHRAEKELDLRIAVQRALRSVRGFASSDAEAFAHRAVELSRRPGVDWEKAWLALYGLGVVMLTRGTDPLNVRETGARLLAPAEERGSASHVVGALYLRASATMLMGKFACADKDFERAIGVAESRPWPRLAVDGLFFSTWLAASAENLWFLGYPDRAVERLHRAIAASRESGPKSAMEPVQDFAAYLYLLLGDLDGLRERAEAISALATESGNLFRLSLSQILLGWTEAEAHDLAGGIARMRRNLVDFRANGAEIRVAQWLSLIAAALGKSGKPGEGLLEIEEALVAIERTGERFHEAEVHRLKGELLRVQAASNSTGAEQSFRNGIEISRKQHAKSWELRGTMSLARLLAKQGKQEEARAMLAEIYDWFTEGFDTADLKDAKVLLDQLSS
jgi:tetratricopeptide (TPR) repeat protein